MILVDTSVWIDHLRQPNEFLIQLIAQEAVLTHPFVIGEIALGSIKNRDIVRREISELQTAVIASDDEVRNLIESVQLYGCGIGYLDAHLVASVRLTEGAKLWSFDKRLCIVSKKQDIAADLPQRFTH